MKLNDVRANYDRAAKYYDFGTDLIFGRLLRVERYRKRAIELLGDLEGATVLDIGCGTGRNFPLLLDRVGPRGRIIGIDYSKGMLQKAAERVGAGGRTRIELIRGDAAVLPNVPAHVDAVISVWTMGIVQDMESALHRALDVLRPGAQIAIMDFGRTRPDHGPLRWMYPIYSQILRLAGIDSAEDLDDDRLRARWKRGRAILDASLSELRAETYLNGMGLILYGTKGQT